ncbi:hypothetical protein WI38_05375 [Burkholderia ubonensis]|uniref:Uncharacterized protein n=1 Tax=Burkholderia ubonensis TaxID=101571 RepID=A0A117XUU5_9BURK|nr:efflux RND transporter permease subunit [Burkholderia ubonensis]KUZ72412.1 hypothetical protein WI35_00115 [Burkholderia ubonensis]KUZ90357.1 hypothetical protein WI39_19005 [Burkholderia ubonensis]KUZ95058.1 hypothetical protein WI38_05375 [Burkholderia ubonensis]
MTLILAPRGARPNQTEIEAQARRALSGIPGARFTVSGSGAGDQLRLILASDDDGALNQAARALESELRGVGSLTNINSTANLERPELVVRPDLDRASNVGASTEAIGDVVRITTSGDFGTNLARLDLDNRQVDINVSMPDAYRRDLSALANLRIPTASGTVPLASVATLAVGSGPSRIDRRDRRRYIVISADLDEMHLGDAISAAYKLPSVLALPTGVALIPDGDAELQGELASSFVTAIVAGILCVYCVLALLFRDLLQPVTILSALPLSIGGALLALLATRNELSVPSMLGLLMLISILVATVIFPTQAFASAPLYLCAISVFTALAVTIGSMWLTIGGVLKARRSLAAHTATVLRGASVVLLMFSGTLFFSVLNR